MDWRERFYRTLLLCYPAEFRYEYDTEMTQAFRDRIRDGSHRLFWFELIADLAWTASISWNKSGSTVTCC